MCVNTSAPFYDEFKSFSYQLLLYQCVEMSLLSPSLPHEQLASLMGSFHHMFSSYLFSTR